MLFTQIEKTNEEKLTDHAIAIVTESEVLYQGLKNQLQTVFNMVWNSNFTAQEVIDALGDKAIPMFTFSAKLQAIMKQADPSYDNLVPPLPYEIINGKIVVTNETI